MKKYVIFQEGNNFINCTEINGKQITGAVAFQIHPPITLITLRNFYSNAYAQKCSSIQNIHCLMPNPTVCLLLDVGHFPSLTCIIFGHLVLILENSEELPGKFSQRQEFLTMIQMITCIICRSLLEKIVLMFGCEEPSS